MREMQGERIASETILSDGATIGCYLCPGLLRQNLNSEYIVFVQCVQLHE